MKKCSKDGIRSNHILRKWYKRATATRKPFECSFGILKGRFSTLSCILLHYEYNGMYLILACVILHNLCMDSGDDGQDFLVSDDDELVSTGVENSEAKQIREALLDFAIKYGIDGGQS